MTESVVLITGAGPTGLVLALWLTRLGVRVRIIDKTAEPGTTSRAVAVQARTLEFYQQMGLADAVVEGGVKVAALNLWAGGARVARAPMGSLGEGMSPFPFPLTFPQDDHERLLVARLAAAGVTVERQTRLVGFTQDATGVRAEIERADGSRETVHAAYLAGCDGAHSTVRETLGTGFPGGTYSGLFYVADVVASGAPANGEIHVEIDEADFLAVFPLKGNGRLRLIGPFSGTADRAPADLTFDDVGQRALHALGLAVTGVNWFSTYRVHHRVASHFREGRAFLLGDAAHVHSPVGGQGMNTGIGDAVNLAWKLAAVLKGQCGEQLLATYEQERIGFARQLVSTTDRAFTFVSQQGPIARFVRTQLMPRVAPLALRLGFARRFIFRTVSQTGISYHASALSAGRAGAHRGGDRLPWVQMGGGTDNYAPLASMTWQVHIYGEPPAGTAEACTQLELPLVQFAWSSAMQRIGLVRNAIYLLRPDGYIAFTDSPADAARMRAYCQTTFLTTPRTA